MEAWRKQWKLWWWLPEKKLKISCKAPGIESNVIYAKTMGITASNKTASISVSKIIHNYELANHPIAQ